jgi:hypothetical protein
MLKINGKMELRWPQPGQDIVHRQTGDTDEEGAQQHHTSGPDAVRQPPHERGEHHSEQLRAALPHLCVSDKGFINKNKENRIGGCKEAAVTADLGP